MANLALDSQTLLIGVGVFLLILVIIGMARGSLKMFLSLIGVAIAIFACVILTPIVSKQLAKTEAYDKIYEIVNPKVEEAITPEGVTEFSQINSGDIINVESQKALIIDKYEIPKSVQSFLKNDLSNAELFIGDMTYQAFARSLSNSISYSVLAVFTFFVLFIIVKVIVAILISALKLVNGSDKLKFVNRLGGGLIGLVEGILVLWVACLLLSAFSGFGPTAEILTMVRENEILSKFYDSNVFVYVFYSMLPR